MVQGLVLAVMVGWGCPGIGQKIEGSSALCLGPLSAILEDPI